MRKSLFVVMFVLLALALIMPLGAQEATPEAPSDMMGTAEPGMMMTDPAVTVTDQVVLNGMVTISAIDAPVAGFVVIHSDHNGMPHHAVGVAPIPQGVSENLAVMIDGAMATPTLHARLHIDDSEPGVFEHGSNPSADAPVSENYTTFQIAAIFSFNQQAIGSTVVIASAIVPDGGWLVIHADNGGSPGPVLGQSLLRPGTNPAVFVALAAEGQTPVVFPMLHVDDNAIGTYEFGQVEGADSPIVINGQVATRPLNLTDTPTLLLADGTVLESSAVPVIVPSLDQMADSMMTGTMAQLVLERVLSVGPGIIDVHSDMDGHPSVSLGNVAVPDGESTNVVVQLMPPPSMPDMMITPAVWPMLHQDTNANGVYDYLKIVGQDLPVIYNGAVVALPVIIGDPAAMSGEMMGTMEPGMEMTPEVTPGG